MTVEELIKAIDELPSSGEWWRESGRSTFIEVATELHLGYEVPIPKIIEILQKLYYATVEEYGE